jgi:acetate kinase
MKILVLNCGSSSLKYQLIDMDTEKVLAKGYFEKIGQKDSFLTHRVNGEKYKYEFFAKDHLDALNFVLKQFTDEKYPVIKSLDEISAIGHRVVHGGEKFKTSTIINDEVKEGIKEAITFAPLHNPANLLGIEVCEKYLPGKPNVAVFDTAFHQTMPKEHFLYPIPYEYYEKYGIRKYGFHGTSHKYVSQRIAELLGKPIEDLKIINCHVGQGASLCAIQNGKSIDTTMGLTPLAGVAMGSRSGDLDPSVVTYIMEKENMKPSEMETMLNKKSGLLGLSKVSADNRDIEDAVKDGDKQAELALNEYHYLIAQYIQLVLEKME